MHHCPMPTKRRCCLSLTSGLLHWLLGSSRRYKIVILGEKFVLKKDKQYFLRHDTHTHYPPPLGAAVSRMITSTEWLINTQLLATDEKFEHGRLLSRRWRSVISRPKQLLAVKLFSLTVVCYSLKTSIFITFGLMLMATYHALTMNASPASSRYADHICRDEITHPFYLKGGLLHCEQIHRNSATSFPSQDSLSHKVQVID